MSTKEIVLVSKQKFEALSYPSSSNILRRLYEMAESDGAKERNLMTLFFNSLVNTKDKNWLENTSPANRLALAKEWLVVSKVSGLSLAIGQEPDVVY